MAELKLVLEGEALREAMTQSILGLLTPEMRQQMIAQAIEAILKPSTNSWNRGKSPLEEAFIAAVNDVTRMVAKEAVAADTELLHQLTMLLKTAQEKLLSSDPEKMGERLAEAFVASIRRDS